VGFKPRAPSSTVHVVHAHDGELQLWFVLAGSTGLELDGRPAASLTAGDCVAIPAGLSHALADCATDLELLEVTLP